MRTGASTRHLGILAHSVEGAALCLRSFAQEGFRQLGLDDHPDVTVDCIALARGAPAWEAGDYASLALEPPGEDLALPGLHIAEVVADLAARDGHTRVGVLGTKYLMDGPVYPGELGSRGIAAELPEAADRYIINTIIFEELVNGVFSGAPRRQYVRIIEKLAARGCEAVALVCTEIPLLVTPDDSPLPTLDSTRRLARAAFDVCRCPAALADVARRVPSRRYVLTRARGGALARVGIPRLGMRAPRAGRSR